MEQSIEVGSIWNDKSGENPVIVLAHNNQRQSVIFTYLLTINGKLDLTESFSSVDLFLKTKELMVTSSSANTEYVKGKTDGYGEGYRHGFTLAKEKITELDELDSNRIYNDGYVKGHNDGWRGAVKAYSFGKSDNEVVDKLDKNYDDGFDDGYNTAIKEMKSDKLNIGVCGSNVPNKETQEAMQEVLDKDSNEFAGVWVAKDGSGKLKVLSVDEGDCDVELIEHVSNSYLCVGDTATISVDDLKEHWTKERVECNYITTEDDQLEKELELVEKYPHYYKDIRHLNIIDIYRFFELFEVTDPCLQHSMKKLAVGGKRGDKDYEKDIKEAMDTLKRWEYMQEENKRGLDV